MRKTVFICWLAIVMTLGIGHKAPAQAQVVAGEAVVIDYGDPLFRGRLVLVTPITGNRTVLHSFSDGTPPLGQRPFGVAVENLTSALVVDQDAGTNQRGALFRVNLTGRTMLSDFGDSGQGPLGGTPQALAIEADGNILVADRDRLLFRVNKDTGARTVLSDFSVGSPLGSSLAGVAVRADGQILVVDAEAGTGNYGAIFQVDPVTGDRQILVDFGDGQTPGVSDDTDPFGIAIDAQGRIFVTDTNAGTDFLGALFRIDPDGARVLLSDFGDSSQGTGGFLPLGIAVKANGELLVTVEQSAAFGRGLLFRIDPDTGARTVLSDFADSNQGPIGRSPIAVAVVPGSVYRLSGSLDGTAPIVVDDDLDVYLNDVLIYTDGTEPAGSRPPIVFSANAGDTLRLVVRDTYGVCAALSPVYLTDPFGNGTLVDDGFDLGCDRPTGDQGVVHDSSFVIPAINNNAPPVLSNVAVTTSIDENGTATLSGDISDADAGDAFTLTVDWGDGSASEVFNYAAGTTSFSETHQYLDDNPTATLFDSYMINVTLSDGAANDTDSAVVTVNNLAPTLSMLAVDPVILQVGESTLLSGDVNDAGTLDSHTITISWGDGSPNTTLNLAAGVTSFSTTHQYNAADSFDISVTATDDDTGSVNAGAGSVTVNAPPPTLPNAPTNLTATRAASRTQIDLTWTDNSNNEDGFKIERCSPSKGQCIFNQIAQTGANVATFSNTGLSKGTKYRYRVRAFNSAGDSAYSNTAQK